MVNKFLALWDLRKKKQNKKNNHRRCFQLKSKVATVACRLRRCLFYTARVLVSELWSASRAPVQVRARAHKLPGFGIHEAFRLTNNSLKAYIKIFRLSGVFFFGGTVHVFSWSVRPAKNKHFPNQCLPMWLVTRLLEIRRLLHFFSYVKSLGFSSSTSFFFLA